MNTEQKIDTILDAVTNTLPTAIKAAMQAIVQNTSAISVVQGKIDTLSTDFAGGATADGDGSALTNTTPTSIDFTPVLDAVAALAVQNGEILTTVEALQADLSEAIVTDLTTTNALTTTDDSGNNSIAPGNTK